MNVAVVYGGKSGEHEISLVSASSVVRNINKNHKVFLIGISKSGEWFLQDESQLSRLFAEPDYVLKIDENLENQITLVPGGGTARAFCSGGKNFNVDVIFPVLHGTFGEDGTVQGLFELLEIPYVGASTISSAVTMDKEKTKAVLMNAGIPVVPGICMRRSDLSDWKKYDELLENIQNDLGFPLFVKPCSAGSSDGANLACDMRHLNGAIMEAFCWDDKILIEKAVDAREIECSVTGNPVTFDGVNSFEAVKSYGPGEIVPLHEFYDYDAKYNDPDGAKLMIPAELSVEKLEEIRHLAEKAYVALDLCGLSRVDFFIDRKDEKIYLNEINSMPGFTKISMFPKMCMAFGLEFEDLTELLINEGIARFKQTRKLKTSR